MRNLALEIDTGSGYQWVWLDDDTSVTINNINPVFDTDAGGTFTAEFGINVVRNSHIFGATADIRGPKIFKLLRNKKARLWVMGSPICGIVRLDSELTVENNVVDIEVASNSKELSDILEDVNAQDVDISDDKIAIGYALPEYIGLHCKASVQEYTYYTYGNNKYDFTPKGSERIVYLDHSIACPKVLFVDWKGASADGVSLPARQFYNVQNPYNPQSPTSHPFCNVRACYQKYVERDGNWEAERGYSVAEPNRINSAPCFYVPYWFHKLWQRLGIAVESDILEKIADYNRLAFFHFDPQFDWGEATALNYNRVSEEQKEQNNYDIYARYSSGHTYSQNNIVIGDIDSTEGIDEAKISAWWINVDNDKKKELIASKHNTWAADYEGMLIHTAYANSKNFPDIEAKTILEAMQTAFGARFIYDSSMTTIKVVLVRDILRQNDATTLPCIVTKAHKTELGTQGFILKYSDASEQEINGITKAEAIVGETTPTYDAQYDADTNYNYNAYGNVIFFPRAANASKGITNSSSAKFQPSDYITLASNITSTDKHCYVSTITGNAFRIKVDSDAKNESELHPSLFEVGICNDYKEGDTSWVSRNDDLVEEVSIPFTPVFENDVNIANEKESYRTDSTNPLQQKFAVLLDGEIHHNDDDSLIERSYNYGALNLKEVYDYRPNGLGNPKGWHSACHIDVSLTIRTIESHEIDNDGPYYESDTGFCLTINRGSGGDAGLVYYDESYDSEDGCKWAESAGSDAECTIDSINQYGGLYDYNGTATETITYTSVSTAVNSDNVRNIIRNNFPDSHANLLSSKRKVTRAAMLAKGWYIDGDYATVFTHTYTINDVDYLVTPIMDNGTILTPYELNSYMDRTNGEELIKFDIFYKNIIIGTYNTDKDSHSISNYYANLLHELHEVYYEGTARNIDIRTYSILNALGYDFYSDYKFPMSLKPRAEKENPKYDPDSDADTVTLDNGTIVPNTRFFPVAGTYAAGRGLGDRFYKEYSYWVLNRKILIANIKAEASVLTSIDMTKKYRVGGVEGYIKEYSYTVNIKKGITESKIELYYI